MSENNSEGVTTGGQAPQSDSKSAASRLTAKTLNNNVKEEIVVKHKKTFSMISYLLMYLFAIVFALFAAIALMGVIGQNGFSIGNLINFVLTGGLAVLMWFGKDYMRVEYEYSFTNGVVDIAQVLNNRKRKELISFKTREVELVASIENPKLHNIEARQGVKKVRAVLNADSEIYFASFRKNEVQYLVYFEPSREFLQFMHLYNERSVIL